MVAICREFLGDGSKGRNYENTTCCRIFDSLSRNLYNSQSSNLAWHHYTFIVKSRVRSIEVSFASNGKPGEKPGERNMHHSWWSLSLHSYTLLSRSTLQNKYVLAVCFCLDLSSDYYTVHVLIRNLHPPQYLLSVRKLMQVLF